MPADSSAADASAPGAASIGSPGGPRGGPPAGGAPRDLGALRAQLERLGRRQRGLLLARALAQALVAICATALLAAGLVSAGLGRDLSLGLLLVAGALALSGALGWPLLLRWRQAGDLRAQARRVEALQPELRSRLLTVVDRAMLVSEQPDQVVPLPVSTVLLDRAVARARPLAQAVPDAAVHPPRALLQASGAALLAVGLVGLATWLLPVGPLPALAALVTGEVAATRIAEGVQVADEQALVGDITLRYVFPDYTGMDAVEVPNSDGTIHAPPGTTVQVTARTAEPFDSAAIQVGDGAPDDVLLSQSRDLSGDLVITGSGTWRFVLFRGDTVVYSPAYRIEAEADQAPTVTTPTVAMSAPVDGPLALPWSADDDFGIRRVVLEIEQDGELREVELRAPLDPRRHLEGAVRMTPRELGLKPGDEVTMRVVAQDNDYLEDGKRGASQDTTVKITGPRASGQRFTGYYRELRDALVLVLADFLVEADTLPVANDPAAMARWVSGARTRFDPVKSIMDEQWGDEQPETVEGELTRTVLDKAARLFRFTLTTFDPGSNRRITFSDLETFDNLHDAEIAALEDAVWMIDKMLHSAAMAEVAESAQGIAEEARELADMAPDAEAAELLARLDQLERLMDDLARMAAQLGEGQLQQFLNSRLEGSEQLLDEIRRSIAEGRMDDARAMLQQLGEQLSQMAQGIQDELSQAQEQEDQLGKAMSEAMEQLDQLEQDQRDLAEELAQARQEEGGEFDQQVQAWKELDELAARAVAQSEGAVEATGDGQGWTVESIRRLEFNKTEIASLRDAIRARDVIGALRELDETRFRHSNAERALLRESQRPRPSTEQLPSGLPVAQEHVREQGRTLDRIEELLDQLRQSQQQTSPELQQRARELSQQQQQLGQRQQQLQQEVQKIEQALPTQQGQATESMQRAGQSMENADQALQQGRPTPGEGHMQEAADQLGNAREELRRQQQQLQQMQQMQRQLQGEQSQGKPRDGEGQDPRQQTIQLPEAEDFTTPEEYRRALLEGMEADVPEEYEALKKQYYEELVRQ